MFGFGKKKNDSPAPKKGRVLVAVSGGVDSSVTLGLMKKEDWEPIAVHMNLWKEVKGTGDCVAVDDLISARQVANKLDVPFYVVNFEKKFKEIVVDDFLQKYGEGLTPNPCVKCNREVKFGLLLQKAKELGCEKMVTGHYVRVRKKGEKFELLNGVDAGKDQSYFLWHLTQEKLGFVMFPLGGMEKSEVKKMAVEMGFEKQKERKESVGACFFKEKDEAPFLKRNLKKGILQAGKIVNLEGEVLGEHEGLALFTIGQREGIGVGGQKKPLYVVRKNEEKNELVVGNDEDLWTDEMRVKNVNWVSGEDVKEKECWVRIRLWGDLVKAEVKKKDGIWRVKFEEKVRAVTFGQSAVFYEKDEKDEEDLVVLGGGEIL